MEKEDFTSKVREFSISSSNGFDFLNLAIDSFCSGIGLLMTERVTDAFRCRSNISAIWITSVTASSFTRSSQSLKYAFASATEGHLKMALKSSLSLQAMLTCKFNCWMAWKISS